MSRRRKPPTEGEAGAEPQAPWPYLRAKAAAKILGVSDDLLRGLAGHKRLRAVQVSGASGQPVWLFCQEDVAVLAAELQAAAGIAATGR